MEMKKVRSTCMLLLTALIWGAAFVAQSVGMDYVGPFTFNSVRSLVGGLFLIPCIAFLDSRKPESERRPIKKMNPQEKRTLFLGGILCGTALCVASSLQQIGIAYTTVGKAGFITALYIVVVPILGIFLKKRVRPVVWLSVAIAVAGLYCLCITDGFSLGKGDLLVMLCAVVFSVHILLIDYFSPKVDGVRMSCIQFLVSGILAGIPMFLTEQPQVGAILSAWAPVLYAGVLSCGVAYTMQVVAQKDISPTVASLILSLESVFSVLAGWIVLGQKLNAKELGGCVLMFGAIVLAQLPEKKKSGFETNAGAVGGEGATR